MGIRLHTAHCRSPPYAVEENGTWIADYRPNTGTYGHVVQQKLYIPRPDGTAAQREPHYKSLQSPIFFTRNDDVHFLHVGINVAQAAQGATHVLVGANDPLSRLDAIQTTSLVLMVRTISARR